MRDLEVIWRPSGEWSWRVILRSILGQSEGHSWTQPTYLSLGPVILLHLAVGRALSLKYTKYWVLGWCWVGTGIALPGPPQSRTTRVHPLPSPPGHMYVGAAPAKLEVVVGLKSVDQLT